MYTEEELQRFETELQDKELELGRRAEKLRQEQELLKERSKALEAQKREYQQVNTARCNRKLIYLWCTSFNTGFKLGLTFLAFYSLHFESSFFEKNVRIIESIRMFIIDIKNSRICYLIVYHIKLQFIKYLSPARLYG